jgi:ABC-2 type transport system ATP-binding protein
MDSAVTRETPAIETVRLTKSYGGRPVVRDLTFQVQPGEVFALVGPNGAGKTTVIRLVSGLAFPTSGTVRMLGEDPHERPSVRRRLGAVVEAPAAFYPYLTGRGNLRLHARLAGGVPGGRIAEVLEQMELTPAADRPVGVYSLGMRQRLGVAAALLTGPAVLVLDEPASGMDPLSLHLVHRVLRDAALQGTAVLLSTHHLEEVVSYCHHVGLLEEGILIDSVDLRDRRTRYRMRVSDVAAAVALLRAQPWVREAQRRGDQVAVVSLEDDRDVARLAPALVSEGIDLLDLGRDVFDLRAHYRERVAAERGRRTAVDALVVEVPAGRAGRVAQPERRGPP